MGGQNHQPCKDYLENSTRLSRSLSIARIEVERANVALEDVLLRELDGEIGETLRIDEHLERCVNAFSDATSHIQNLQMQMEENRYQELPSLAEMDLGEVGHALVQSRAVSDESWNRIVDMRLAGGFIAVLEHFIGEIETLTELIGNLRRKINRAQSVAMMGEMNLLLEENRDGNFKLEFAQVYSVFHIFMSDFLASSLLSTEVWYAFNDAGSITSQHPVAVVG